MLGGKAAVGGGIQYRPQIPVVLRGHDIVNTAWSSGNSLGRKAELASLSDGNGKHAKN